MVIRRVYFCGGGMNAIAIAGVLTQLEKVGELRFVKEWMGISAGAFGAMGLAAGYTVPEMARFLLEFDYSLLTDPDDASGWLMNMGYDTCNRIERFLIAMLKEKGFGLATTFEQLTAKTGLSLRVWATNLNTGRLVEFSEKTTPTYHVIHAVRASLSLPYYYQPFKCPVSGDTYMDGGVITNYPLNYLTENERRETLGILITYMLPMAPTLEFQDLLLRPLMFLIKGRSDLEYEMFKHQTIKVMIKSGNPMNFAITMEQKLDLVNCGLEAVKEYLQVGRRPVRRYSVS